MSDIEYEPAGDDAPSIFQRLIAVSRDVDHIEKGNTTKASGGYKYRGVDDVLNIFGPILRKHGVVAVPVTKSIQHRELAANKNGNVAHEVMVEMGYRFYGPLGDSVEFSGYGESADFSDKATSQAQSVALRTAFLHGFTTPTGDPDPDEHEISRGAQQAPRALSNEETIALNEAGWDTLAERDQGWDYIVAVMTSADPAFVLSDPIREAMTAYGVRLGLDPATFTRQQGLDWIAEAQRLVAAENAEPAPADGTEPFETAAEASERKDREARELLAAQNDKPY